MQRRGRRGKKAKYEGASMLANLRRLKGVVGKK